MRRKICRCHTCYNKFVFTASEQKLFKENGWKAPIRCKECREKLKEYLIMVNICKM
ncbi:MAG: zinc-ribbon domain containing protein [Clostridia bacterium]|nr:zinc-ribbon domain containing protein [Clostridia bacterium]